MSNTDKISIEKHYLYFCDGKACDEGLLCYRFGGDCYHTLKKDHALSKQLKDVFPPTVFKQYTDDVYVETIDEYNCICEISEKGKCFTAKTKNIYVPLFK